MCELLTSNWRRRHLLTFCDLLFRSVPAWGRHVTECIAQSTDRKSSWRSTDWSVSTHCCALATDERWVRFFCAGCSLLYMYCIVENSASFAVPVSSRLAYNGFKCVRVSNDITIILDFVTLLLFFFFCQIIMLHLSVHSWCLATIVTSLDVWDSARRRWRVTSSSQRARCHSGDQDKV